MTMWLSPRTRNVLEKELALPWGRAWKRAGDEKRGFWFFNYGLFMDLTGPNGK